MHFEPAVFCKQECSGSLSLALLTLWCILTALIWGGTIPVLSIGKWR